MNFYQIKKNGNLINILLIILSTTLLLWHSTHSLSLQNRTNQFKLKQDFGLYQLEKTNEGMKFHWTKRNGGFSLMIKEPIIQIPLLATHPDIQINPVKVKIFLVKDLFKQKILLDEFYLKKKQWSTRKYIVSKHLGQEVILLFNVNRTWNPKKILGWPDPRDLGLAIGEIVFKKVEQE